MENNPSPMSCVIQQASMHTDIQVVREAIDLIAGGSNRASCCLLEEVCYKYLFNGQHTMHLLEIYQWHSKACSMAPGFHGVIGWRDLPDESKRVIRLMHLHDFLSYLENKLDLGVQNGST